MSCSDPRYRILWYTQVWTMKHSCGVHMTPAIVEMPESAKDMLERQLPSANEHGIVAQKHRRRWRRMHQNKVGRHQYSDPAGGEKVLKRMCSNTQDQNPTSFEMSCLDTVLEWDMGGFKFVQTAWNYWHSFQSFTNAYEQTTAHII